MNIYTLINIKQIINRGILYGIGNTAQHTVIIYMGK